MLVRAKRTVYAPCPPLRGRGDRLRWVSSSRAPPPVSYASTGGETPPLQCLCKQCAPSTRYSANNARCVCIHLVGTVVLGYAEHVDTRYARSRRPRLSEIHDTSKNIRTPPVGEHSICSRIHDLARTMRAVYAFCASAYPLPNHAKREAIYRAAFILQKGAHAALGAACALLLFYKIFSMPTFCGKSPHFS